MANISNDKILELKNNRLGSTRKNKQGCFMKLISYNGTRDCLVEFQDEYKAKVHTD
jgi:hypothetical protein